MSREMIVCGAYLLGYLVCYVFLVVTAEPDHDKDDANEGAFYVSMFWFITLPIFLLVFIWKKWWSKGVVMDVNKLRKMFGKPPLPSNGKKKWDDDITW